MKNDIIFFVTAVYDGKEVFCYIWHRKQPERVVVTDMVDATFASLYEDKENATKTVEKLCQKPEFSDVKLHEMEYTEFFDTYEH